MNASLLYWTLVFWMLAVSRASPWLKDGYAAAQLSPQLYLLGQASPRCAHSATNLSPLQNALCVNGGYQDHMASVGAGLRIAVQECQQQFKSMRWNCSTVDERTLLEGQGAIPGTREDSFVRAIASAGVTYAVARGCRNGLMAKCGCSKRQRPGHLNKDWVWGGCGDNVEYAVNFTDIFVGIREKEKTSPKKSLELSLTLANKHNYEAGRRAVSSLGERISCKCHGTSGSCSLKSCWEELPVFRDSAALLRKKYDEAVLVKFNRAGTSLVSDRPSQARYSNDTLIYLRDSPNFCDSNEALGSKGTEGRECNATSSGPDSCEHMCCYRGYNVYEEEVMDRCDCKFVWCCYVQCDVCARKVRRHVCK